MHAILHVANGISNLRRTESSDGFRFYAEVVTPADVNL